MRELGEVVVPNGESGMWRVEDIEVSEADSMMSSLHGGLGYCPAGTYKRLVRGSCCVMSNTRMEQITNYEPVRRAQGRVLINGLGLGMVLTAILKKPEVSFVRVVELSEDVIRLVAPSFTREAAAGRLEIIHANALQYRPARGERFDVVWHDIWDNICSDNLDDMKLLHRRYGRRCDWQGSWARGMWR